MLRLCRLTFGGIGEELGMAVHSVVVGTELDAGGFWLVVVVKVAVAIMLSR
ncbi:MAG: hypothetical protein M2R45_01316 [Verrucomicrobia subdivision 3 bacterium]|nr:hypothetical protein [Limisphaerales bacterium]MCS1415182.1 hypothetical protein [Limisphaerales bacterium]